MQARPARPHEYDAIVQIIDDAFAPDDRAANIVRTTIAHDPRFRSDHLRVVERAGRIVGVLQIVDRLVHIGKAQVRCAIIAPLAVPSDPQSADFAASLLHNALDWARSNGFELALWWGATALYPAFGFAPGSKGYTVVVPANAAPRGDQAYTLRAAQAADAPALLRAYHIETARRTLAEIRSDEPWEWRPYDVETMVEVAVDPARTVRGYARIQPGPDRLQVDEIVAMDMGAAQALYDRLLYLAGDRHASEIRVVAPPDHRWSKLAFAQGAQVCVSALGGSGMIRILDFPALLRTIVPELQRRVAASEFVARRAEVRIETPAGRATIRVDHGEVVIGDEGASDTVTLPFHALSALVAGYQAIDDLIGGAGVFVQGIGTIRLLNVLFPEGYPHWSTAAYFA